MKIDFTRFVDWLKELTESKKYYTLIIQIEAGQITHIEKRESLKEL